MTDWVPLDEKELLREDEVYHDSNSPNDQQAPGRGALPSPSPEPSVSGSVSSLPRGGGREVSREMILRALEKQGSKRRPPPNPDDPHAEDRFLAAQSHLHLNGLHIGRIANLRPMATLEVLYLYDNQISVIEGLSHLRRLTHLYLSNNAISCISGLEGLQNLQKLYLEQNCLTLISGLESCPSLEELHVSSQRLPPGASLAFDPPSVAALAPSLRVLTAASCALTAAAVRSLAGLSRLRRLDLGHNTIRAEDGGFEALDGVAGPGSAPLLSNLDLRGNPVCRAPKYRDTLILMNDSLSTIDDEPVSPQHREFLLRLHIRRMKAQLAAELRDDATAPAGAAPSAAGTSSSGACGGPGAGYGVHLHGHPGPGGPAAPAGANGAMGQGSRVPPRGGGGGGGARPSVGRNASGGAGGGGGGAAGVTLGMDGLAISR